MNGTGSDWFLPSASSEELRDLNGMERIIYIAVKSFCGGETRCCWASYRKIGERAGVSSVTAMRHIRSLLDKERVEKVGEQRVLGGHTNILRVVAPERDLSARRVTIDEKPSRAESVSSSQRGVSKRLTKANESKTKLNGGNLVGFGPESLDSTVERLYREALRSGKEIQRSSAYKESIRRRLTLEIAEANERQNKRSMAKYAYPTDQTWSGIARKFGLYDQIGKWDKEP